MIGKVWGENGQGLNNVWLHCPTSFSSFRACCFLWSATQNGFEKNIKA